MPSILSFLSLASVIQSSRTHCFTTTAIVPHTEKTKVVLVRMSHDNREKKKIAKASGGGEEYKSSKPNVFFAWLGVI
jgi:hypothetical protein